MQGGTVKAEIFQLTVGIVEDGAARVLVDTTGFHAHQAVLADIHNAHAVAGADLVQLRQELHCPQLLAVHRHGPALLEVHRHILRLIRRLLRCLGNQEHGVFRLIGRVLKVGAFVGQMPDIAIHAVSLVLGGNGNAVLLGVLNLGAAGVKIPFTPGSDNGEVRSQGLHGQLEAHLVIALTGGAVGNGICALLTGNLHQALGNQRTGEGSAQQILALIDGIRLQGRPDIIHQEFLGQIVDIDLGSPGFQGFLPHRLQLVPLAYIYAGCNDLAAVIILLQPGNDNGGIKPAGISQHDFLNINLCHNKASPFVYISP